MLLLMLLLPPLLLPLLPPPPPPLPPLPLLLQPEIPAHKGRAGCSLLGTALPSCRVTLEVSP